MKTKLPKIILFIKKVGSVIWSHKIISAIILIALVWGGYYLMAGNKTTATRYVMGKVEKVNVITSITGSGQVSASNQVDLKAKVSGNVTYAPVLAGQEVKVGTLIVQLDSRDMQKSVRDAEISLASAKLSLEKLQAPTDTLSLAQAENALTDAEDTKQNAEDSLAKAYDDGYNTVANAFLDLPTVVTGLDDTFFKATLSANSGQNNIDWYANQVNGDSYNRAKTYRDDLYQSYTLARNTYDQNFSDYKATARTSDKATIENLILETYNTTKIIADTVKTGNNLVDFVQDFMSQNNYNIPGTVNTHQSLLDTYTSKTNSDLLSLLNIKQTIEDSKTTIDNSTRTITEKTLSLEKLKAGADQFDLQSAELSVKQKDNALLDAKQALSDYYIRAPFDGTLAAINVKKTDEVSSGTAVATLITKQKLATVSLNEVDVAKLKIGQKATLTFDAIEGLSISGQVVEIATIGTVSSGVVTYNVKIGFDTQDDRVKSGMSVNATIITDFKSDVLTVPNGAVKTKNGSSYVETFNETLPDTAFTAQGFTPTATSIQKTVEIGITNDTTTEITSGLSEGDSVITKTISGTGTSGATVSKTTTTRTPSLFGGGPMGR